MEDFLKKWNNDSRFKTKIKLSLYTLFVVFVAIFAVSGRNNIPTNQIEGNLTQEDNQTNNNETENTNITVEKINIPDEYKYKINITINEMTYQYIGNKNKLKETIVKKTSLTETNYVYENGEYYKENNNQNYLLTSKEEVYNIIDYSYLDLNTVNQYLSKAEKTENEYRVYLKDIILGTDNQNYITISKTDNKVNIDYTNLFNYFDKETTKNIVEIEIEE